ncbi:MAG TPA: ABC transporter ATP-binding protein [Acidimicrobiales bacterium]|nr:ABC transporter ATP-binding protein [Acidimicrobiales bacterium]
MTEVAVRSLSRTYAARPPVTALGGVDLDVPGGSLTAVLGPSGCGKTTLLRILAGFDQPDGGTITFDGEEVSRPGRAVPPERRRVGIVPQEGALFPHLDVAANVAFGLRGQRGSRVAEVLELVGLAGFERRRPHELSGGQQQRVALARALAPRPAVVLLDEPFTALDASLRDALRRQVAATLKAAGTTAVLVTHDQGEALAMAGHLAVMREGRIVQAGPPSEVYHRPVDVDVARFLGEAVLLPAQVVGGRLECALGPVIPMASPTHAGSPASGSGPSDLDAPIAAIEAGAEAETNGIGLTVCLRPEQVGRDDASPQRATVTAVHYLGHDALIDLVVTPDATPVRARWVSLDLPRPGDDVGLAVLGPVVTFPST